MVRKPYPRVLRLHLLVAENWAAFDGHYAGRGVDPLLLSPQRFANLAYCWLAERVEDREALDAELDKPLPGKEASQVSAEAERASFDAFMAQVGVGKG